MNQTWWIHEMTQRYSLGEIDAGASATSRTMSVARIATECCLRIPEL
jgi:hypothetical protein